MSRIFKTGGYGGNGSSSDNSAQTLYVPDEYVFTSATTIAEAQAARDAYFIAHPTELNKAVVITKTDDNSQVLMEKYDNGAWVDITTVIKGPKGDTGDTGAAGANGTNGTNGANGTDGKDLNWRGEWVSTTAYLPVDGVRFDGSSYYCLVANTGKEPSTNATEWSLACSKGLDGADGAGYVSKGGYNASTTYDIGSVVTYEGSSYACIKEPALDKMPTDSSYWVIVAKKGDTGISGLTAKGAYSGLIAYSVNDVVEYLGSAYVCYVASQGVLPTDTTKWAILVTKGAAGDQGPKGDTGASIVWKGDYATGTAYAVNDVVIYEGSAWVCVGTSTGNAPSASSSYWDMMCSKGDPVALVDKSTWAAGTVYTSGDVVMHVSLILVCVESHTASTNFDDDAAKWVTTGVGAILSDSGAEWVSGTVYPLQVMVTHAGYKWTCIAEHESAATWDLDSEWWAKIGVAESLTDGGAWAASTHYNLGAVVTQDGSKYAALLDHTSSSDFATDTAKWVALGGKSALTDRGTWVTATAYVIADVVAYLGTRYACVTSHTSSVFATDSSKWCALGNNLSATPLAFGNSVAAQGMTYTTTYPLSASTWTNVTAGAVNISSQNIQNNSGSLMFTITQAGKYRISAQSVVTNTYGANWCSTRIYRISGGVGTAVSTAPAEWVGSLSAGQSSMTECIIDLAVNDTIICQTYSQYAGYMQGGYLTVEQLPIVNAVQAGTLVATDLSLNKRYIDSTGIAVTVGTNIPFAYSEYARGSNVTYNGADNTFTLVAGKTYRIEFHPGTLSYGGSTGVATFSLWNTIANAAVGTPGQADAGSRTADYSKDSSNCYLIFTPTTGASIAARITAATSLGGTIQNSSISIEELPSQSVVMVGDATSVGNAAKVSAIASCVTLAATTGAVALYTTSFTNTYTNVKLTGSISLYGTVSGLQVINVKVDGTIVGYIKQNTNTINQHYTVPFDIIVSGLTAGTHTLTFTSEYASSATNTSDFITVNLTEYAPAGTYFQTSANTIEWQNYTPTIGVYSGTAPTLATTNTLRARYKVVGKSLFISFTYFAASSTGASAGTGAYTISLPSGYTINTSLAQLPSTIATATSNYSGADASTLGTCNMAYSSSSIQGTVVPLNSNKLGLYLTYNPSSTTVYNTLWGSAAWTTVLAGLSIQFIAEIPIN